MTRKAAREAKKLQNPLPPPVGRAITTGDILAALGRSPYEWFTMRQICEMVGRHVSPTMRGHVATLVAGGQLEREQQELINHTVAYVYRVKNSESYGIPF